MKLPFPAAALFCTLLLVQNVIAEDENKAEDEGYYGKPLGALSEHHHAVKGFVYAVDSRTLHIRHFSYDGLGPGAYFYAGNSKSPSGSGFRLRDERGSPKVLRKYNDEHITLSLPEGKTLNSIKWFSVWCEDFSVNFGDVRIPKGFQYPKPLKLGSLSGIHHVSSDPVVIVDAQTFLVPNFSYDGEAPDAKFWVGSGEKPTSQGIKVADENGHFEPLGKYDGKTLVITLPGGLTVHEIGHFGVWCEAFAVDFGHVEIPASAAVPPSLRMLGVAPQSRLNCEVLHKPLEFEVRWAIAGESAVIQLVGKVETGDYMSFGLSGDDTKTKMIGGDAVVAWIDPEDNQGYAVDYYLEGKSQCAGSRGSCPDTKLKEGTESIRLLNSALVNGYSIVTYQRSLKGADDLDRPIFNNGTEQAIIWGVGPLNSKKEVSFHSAYPKGNVKLNFTRVPEWNCPQPEDGTHSSAMSNLEKEMSSPVAAATPKPVEAPKDAWSIPPIPCYEPDDGVFYAQMGPTGGKRGYSAITGHVGWGISWFINGLLIPEINVVRGKSYTFVVEGGDNPEIPARYHPFYITDDPVGGYEHKTAQERKAVKVYAGVKFDKRGRATPTGTGRLCNWTPDPNHSADDSPSFGAYQQTLKLECDPGEPGILRWTPDKDTPDTIYYQCFTHRYLGWKINVVDSCDEQPSSDDLPEDSIDRHGTSDDHEEAASVNFETRVKVPVGEKIETPSLSAAHDLFPPSAAQVSYVSSLTSRGDEIAKNADASKEHPDFESPKHTETLEPMFVASPVDRNIKETPRVHNFRPQVNKGKHFIRRAPPQRLRYPPTTQKRAAPYYRRPHHHLY
ncbi:protein Skeletor, isoforms B/C isoform X2 [Neocloeon triangulifer]|uniref:protein Skeletor, isoforms B/C isoform X2 n=1 Tax=Neocloeon triangulifer TaxID=2078957 RepID=UPI00286EC190|nr:protein Skeletor, isoforms B/C isoform X2 [Neocloeon triangulifer]